MSPADTAERGGAPGDVTLRLSRTFAAPAAQVFRAWTEPGALQQWWRPHEGFSVPRVEVDLRVGGRYRVTMQNPGGEQFHIVGTYREIEAPRRLVYTWQWEGISADVGETLVTVEFEARGDVTEVHLRHECFPDGATRDRHGEGWRGCLRHLTDLLQ